MKYELGTFYFLLEPEDVFFAINDSPQAINHLLR